MIIRSYEYNLCLPGVMSFHLVPHLPRLVAMIVTFVMHERNMNNSIYYFLVILLFVSFIILFIYLY